MTKSFRVPHSWLSVHPGGALAILHFIGRDATDEIEAYHSDDSLRTMRAYAVGTVRPLKKVGILSFLRSISGWIRKVGDDGAMYWHQEAELVSSSGLTPESPSSQILLVKRDDTPATSPSLSSILPPPTILSPKQQAEHSTAYKALHKTYCGCWLYKRVISQAMARRLPAT